MRHPHDRRGVVVALIPEAGRLIEEMYGPIGQAGLARLTRYSAEELRLLRAFLREGRAFQIEHAERIRGIAARRTSSRS